jgi:hypothetical protein
MRDENKILPISRHEGGGMRDENKNPPNFKG